jgi:hypothetical protein
MIARREFVRRAFGATVFAVIAPRAALAARAAAPIAMTVYKSPACGCCKEWITHVEANGFACRIVDMDDVTPMKRTAGVPKKLESCHTALVGAYVIEGHVPADLIKGLLARKPKVLGLSVPDMPLGAPGMETSGPAQPYKVMAFMKDGSSRLYASRG